MTGECKCSAGWTGEDCSKACPMGMYGEECKYQCHCGNGGTCDPVSGACVCAAGWRGKHCEEGQKFCWISMELGVQDVVVHL